MSKEEFYEYLHKVRGKESLFVASKVFGTYDLEQEYRIYHFRAYNEQHSTIGLCFILFNPQEIIDKEDMDILSSFKKIFNAMLLKEFGYYKLQQEKRELLEKVILDALTGVYNRYYLDEILPKEFQKAQRHGYPIAVVMIDIDHFKHINDRYGHNVGDVVLKDFAKFLKSNVREGDFLFRYGGEEFVVLMPFANARNAKKVMDRLLSQLRKRRVKVGDLELSYTFSAGVCDSSVSTSPVEVLRLADEALYAAKRAGRQRVFLCEGVEE